MANTKFTITNSHDPYINIASSVKSSDKFWRWGDDNMLPTALALMSRRSTTHRRIINDKSDYICGQGFSFDSEQVKSAALIKRCNGEGESLRRVLKKLSYDKCLFGNAFLEVVTDKRSSFLSLYHHDASQCRVSKDNTHIIMHPDWSHYKESEAMSIPLYPSFEEAADGSLRSIIHYKDYEPQFTHYGVPVYVAGMGVSAIAYKTDQWNISRLDNSFQMSGVMLLDDAVDNEMQAEQVMRAAQDKFGGKPGQVLFVVKDGSDSDNSRFIPISSSSDGDWHTLHDQAVEDIVVAHSWYRSLSGLDYSSGWSSERILHEWEVALNCVILSEQAEFLEPIRRVVEHIFSEDCSSLEIINTPPTRSKPDYMMVWEARKADGLDFDETDQRQQQYISEIASYYSTNSNY